MRTRRRPPRRAPARGPPGGPWRASSAPLGLVRPVGACADLGPGGDQVRVRLVEPAMTQAVARSPSSPSSRSVADRSSSGAPPALVTSTVPFQATIATRPSSSREPMAWTMSPAPSPMTVDGKPLREQLLEHPQAPPARLAQIADGEQPEAAVQQPRRTAELLEVVGDRPVGEGLGAAHRGRHAAHQVGGAPRRIVDRVEVAGVRAPLGPPLRKAREAVARGDRAEVERRVAVRVGRDEVDRRARRPAVRQQLVHPLARRRGGPAHDQLPVDRLDGAHADVVEAQVLLAGSGPEDVEVRLVPDLEAPAADLLETVSVDQVRRELVNQGLPSVPVLRRADDGAVVEHGLRRIGGEIARHEAQLDDRPQAEARGRGRRSGRCR